jgi:hypothetical protein
LRSSIDQRIEIYQSNSMNYVLYPDKLPPSFGYCNYILIWYVIGTILLLCSKHELLHILITKIRNSESTKKNPKYFVFSLFRVFVFKKM